MLISEYRMIKKRVIAAEMLESIIYNLRPIRIALQWIDSFENEELKMENRKLVKRISLNFYTQ
jgi:hypothetical protein